MLKHAILGFLRYRSSTGYEIKQHMDTSTAHFWHAKQSQIYTVLKKMEADGLVTSEQTPQEGRPDRRVYTIADSGNRDLQAWLSEPMTNMNPCKEALLLKIFFSASIDKDTILTQLRLQHNMHAQQAALYSSATPEVIKEVVANNPELMRDSRLWDATRRFGQMYEEMYVKWLDETIAMVDKDY